MMHDPWEKVKVTIELLFGPLERMTGEGAEDLRAAERRLGIRLPALLSNYYQQVGRLGFRNRVKDHFLPPEKIALLDEVLVFLVESEGGGCWGILAEDLGQADPPVYCTHQVDEESYEWIMDAESLSEFLIGWALWQAVYGGMPHVGVFTGAEDLIDEIARHWPEVTPQNAGWAMRVFARKGEVICAMGSGVYHMATLDPRGFDEVERLLNVTEWDMKETGDGAAPGRGS